MSQFVIQGDTLSKIARAIRVKRGLVDPMAPGEMAGEIMEIGDGILPAGIKAISENGLFDITEFAFVDVNVETGPTGGIGARLASWLPGNAWRVSRFLVLTKPKASMKQEV